MFLASTPAIARLLFLAFSRLRELDADALAVDLIDDPEALAAALSKLEHFHSGLSPWGAHLQHDAPLATVAQPPRHLGAHLADGGSVVGGPRRLFGTSWLQPPDRQAPAPRL